MSGEEFKNRFLFLLGEYDGTADSLDRVAGCVERVLEAWGEDEFAVGVTVNKSLGIGKETT